MERWETYETTRPRSLALQTVENDHPVIDTPQRLRVTAIRELIRFEMPDRVTDVFELKRSNGEFRFADSKPVAVQPVVLARTPSLSSYYYQFALGHAKHPWNQPDGGWTAENQGAECLYMILSRIEYGDGSALQLFSDKRIGDTDKKVPLGSGRRNARDS